MVSNIRFFLSSICLFTLNVSLFSVNYLFNSIFFNIASFVKFLGGCSLSLLHFLPLGRVKVIFFLVSSHLTLCPKVLIFFIKSSLLVEIFTHSLTVSHSSYFHDLPSLLALYSPELLLLDISFLVSTILCLRPYSLHNSLEYSFNRSSSFLD